MRRLEPLLPFLGVLAGGVVSILVAKLAGLGLFLWARSWLVLTPGTSTRDIALLYSVAIAVASLAAILAGMASAWIGRRLEAPCGALASWASVLSIVGTSRSVSAEGVPLSTALVTCSIVFCPVFGMLGALAIARVRAR